MRKLYRIILCAVYVNKQIESFINTKIQLPSVNFNYIFNLSNCLYDCLQNKTTISNQQVYSMI